MVIALGAGYAETCKSGSGGGIAETAGETQYGAAMSTSHLMQMNASYIVTDPKGTVVEECGKMLQRGGYEIKIKIHEQGHDQLDFSLKEYNNRT